jgi:two-component system response regulator FixJ
MDTSVISPPVVVLIDDDAALLRALRFSLELEGFAVSAHRSGATVKIGGLPASNACLVIDYFLPGANGIDLLARLRRDGAKLPAIIITSHAGEALRASARSLNARIVEKPLLGPELSAEIRTLLGPRTVTP